MSLCGSIRQSYARGPSLWLSKVDQAADVASRATQSVLGATTIAHHIGHRSIGLNQTHSVTRQIDGFLGVFRTGCSIEKAVSGRAFFVTNPDGSFKVKDGHYVRRGWLDVSINVSILAARCVTTTSYLEGKKAFSLGAHSRGIGHAIGGLWTLVSSLCLMSSLKALFNADTWKNWAKQLAATIASTFELASSIFEVSCVSQSSPALGIAGGALSLATGLSWLVYELGWGDLSPCADAA